MIIAIMKPYLIPYIVRSRQVFQRYLIHCRIIFAINVPTPTWNENVSLEIPFCMNRMKWSRVILVLDFLYLFSFTERSIYADDSFIWQNVGII